jgi:hypothetical protein
MEAHRSSIVVVRGKAAAALSLFYYETPNIWSRQNTLPKMIPARLKTIPARLPP